jgi:hypothetical protein
VERFEVEVFDWLRGERVKRPIPDYETLELAFPEDVIEAKDVQVRAKVQPGYLSSALFSLASAAPGPRWQPIPAGEARLLHGGVSYSLTSNAVDPFHLGRLASKERIGEGGRAVHGRAKRVRGLRFRSFPPKMG